MRHAGDRADGEYYDTLWEAFGDVDLPMPRVNTPTPGLDDLDLPTLLRDVAEAARDLVGARYAAIGVLDPDGTYLSEFITVGLDDDQRAAIGDPPKGHGVLGLLISEPRAIRLPDIREHAASFGFPVGHPPMTTFLGVFVSATGTLVAPFVASAAPRPLFCMPTSMEIVRRRLSSQPATMAKT